MDRLARNSPYIYIYIWNIILILYLYYGILIIMNDILDICILINIHINNYNLRATIIHIHTY